MLVLIDVKYAVRLLLKKPGFTVLVTLVMASAIGLSVYLLSFMHLLIFKPLPFKDGESLIKIAKLQKRMEPLNLHDYQEIRTGMKGLVEFSAFIERHVNISGRDGAFQYQAAVMEPNLFRLTRTGPILGREFTEAENQPSAEPVTIISYHIWRNQFALDPGIIDEMLQIDGVSHRIVGVMPESYTFPRSADLWLTMRETATTRARENVGDYYGVAHIQNGFSREQINRQLAVIMQRLEQKYPKTNGGASAVATSFQRAMVGDSMPIIYAMHIAAFLILILAAVNVGNLLLARGIERAKETAIRVALGAPRLRLISQMMWESVIICTLGGIIGLLFVGWGLEVTQPVVTTFFSGDLPFWWKFGLDGYSVMLAVLFVVAAVFVTGLLPAWKNTDAEFNSILRDGTRGALGRKAGRLSHFLVVSEIFLSLMVLIIAVVMIVAAYVATHADYGANPENILTAKINLNGSAYGSPEKRTEFFNKLQSRLESNSSVGDVMLTTNLPGEYAWTPSVAVENREYTGEGNERFPKANYILVMPGTLKKLGVQLKEGRYFNSGDEGSGKASAIVTESFASLHLSGGSPLGKRVRVVETDDKERDWLTIVGVVEHTSQGAANETISKAPSIFRPYSQAPRSSMVVAMKMKSDRITVERTLRSTISSVDPQLPASRIEYYEEGLARIVGPIKFMSTVFLLFGIAAVVLAASGIYGVMSNTINQRTQEIGVKRALGATDSRILREFMAIAFLQLLWGGIPGLLLGTVIGYAMSKATGTGGADLAFIVAFLSLIMTAVVILATWIPGRRTFAMEPADALRYQ